MFFWFGRNRRLAKDFENLAGALVPFVALAFIRLALRRLALAQVVNSTNRRPASTITKVAKSDCEGTFARASDNDEVAAFPAVRG